jgi:glycosyltransferase involved in cell wall biosynthesis
MKVLFVHNQYQQPSQQPGGEYIVMLAEEGVLRAAGHRVVEYIRHNDEIKDYGLGSRATLPLRTVWAWDSYREIKALLQRERPDLAHFHNTFPLISPAAYYACREAGVPLVQTLHNYRLLCPAATFRREGRVCEDCLGRNPWRGVLHGCYRDSRAATTTMALMLAVHRWMGTWMRLVDCYIALTEFSRKKFIEAGLPAEKIAVKPNFAHQNPGAREGTGEYAVFVGRLGEEKGLPTLFAAWERLTSRVPLEIVGDGPLRPALQNQAQRGMMGSIHFCGWMSSDRTLAAIQQARFLVFPSECYETFGLVAIEAFACGVPVIASRLGAMEEVVEDGRTGLHFTPGDPEDLAAKVEWAWTHPKETEAMGRAARAEYEAKYTADRNYQTLMEIYERAIAIHKAG